MSSGMKTTKGVIFTPLFLKKRFITEASLDASEHPRGPLSFGISRRVLFHRGSSAMAILHISASDTRAVDRTPISHLAHYSHHVARTSLADSCTLDVESMSWHVPECPLKKVSRRTWCEGYTFDGFQAA